MIIFTYLTKFYQIVLLRKMLPKKYIGKFIIIIFPILISLVSITLIKYKVSILLVNILIILMYFLFFIICFLKKIKIKILILIFLKLTLLKLFIKNTVMFTLCLLLNENIYISIYNKVNYLIIVTIINTIWLVILLIVYKNKSTINFEFLYNDNRIFLMTTFYILVILYFLILDILYILKFESVYIINASIIAMIHIYLTILLQINRYKINKLEHINDLLKFKIINQKKIYKQKNEYSKLLKIYNHDFKSILSNALLYLKRGEIKNAEKILLNFQLEINKVIQENKNYSNRLIVDIILNNLSEKCKENNIKFSANCYIPENFNVEDLDLSRIFNNLSNNAYEACLKQKKQDKYIDFKSYIENNNIIIYVENSFNGEILIKNRKLTTTKENKEIHGIGIHSIVEVLNRINGIYLIKIDNENKIFKFLIKIPYNQS